MTRFSMEYASALYGLAREEHIESTVAEQLESICALLRAEPKYLQLLAARSVDAQTRKQLLEEAFAAHVHVYVLHFMKLLIDRGAIAYFEECAAAYKQMFDADFGVEQAHAVSAAPLSEEQVSAIRAKLEKVIGRRIEISCKVDPSLIGGVRVDVAGKRFDNTVRTRLDGLRRTLTGNE